MLVLGFGASRYVELIVSISYPLTNAFPGPIWYTPRSSDANVPPWVNSPCLYTPLLPRPSFKEFFTITSNGVIV